MTAAPKKKHRLRRAMLWILLTLLLLLGGAIGLGAIRAQYRVTYQGYVAQAGALTDEMSFDSVISLVDSQTVTASQPGKVRRVMKQPGEAVKKGDTILLLESGERIRSDVDGQVNTVPFGKGDAFRSGDTLVTVADFTHVKVEFNANEYNISRLYRGRECTVKITADGQTYPAQLSSVSLLGSINRNVANYSCVIYLDVDGSRVHPGMQVKVSFQETLAEDAVIVSRSALSFDADNQAFVYLKDDDGGVVRHPVTLGALNDKDAQVLSGLESGQVFYARVKPVSPMEMMMRMMQANANNRQNGYGNGGNGYGGNRQGNWNGGNGGNRQGGSR